MNAPQHSVDLKRQDWAEQTTCRAFMLNAGTPDGDDVRLMLIVLADHWERIWDKFPEHADEAGENAHDAILKAIRKVGAALEQADSDPVSEEADFRQIDHRARLENVR